MDEFPGKYLENVDNVDEKEMDGTYTKLIERLLEKVGSAKKRLIIKKKERKKKRRPLREAKRIVRKPLEPNRTSYVGG